jgi:hypothetical protein
VWSNTEFLSIWVRDKSDFITKIRGFVCSETLVIIHEKWRILGTKSNKIKTFTKNLQAHEFRRIFDNIHSTFFCLVVCSEEL